MGKWTGLQKRITAEDAERETDQLFDRPQRPPSAALQALLRRVPYSRGNNGDRQARGAKTTGSR